MSRDAKSVFEILVREHSDMLWAYLRSTIFDKHAAEDLFQEAITVAWRRLEDFDHERSFGAWLRGIAGKLVLSYFRKTATRSPALVDAEALEALSHRYATIEESGEDIDARIQVLNECMDGLDSNDRNIVDQHYEEAKSCKEIATLVGLSVEAVKKRLQRSRAALADCIERKARAEGVHYG